VSAKNKVTTGQVARARGGASYDRGGFEKALAAVLSDRESLGESGRRYVEAECAWPAFDTRLEQLTELVAN
jgi:hypothetical protein